jgi:hypothetical protein
MQINNNKIMPVTFKEAARAAPEEMPPRTPSSMASLLAFAMASSDDTVTTSSITDMSRFCGRNPGPTPCILCGPGSPPEIPRGELYFVSIYIFALIFRRDANYNHWKIGLKSQIY